MYVCMSLGADVNIADNAGNSPLHVVLAAHQQHATQQLPSAAATLSSPKELDKAPSLREVFIAIQLTYFSYEIYMQ